MKMLVKLLFAASLGLGLDHTSLLAQTDGTAKLEVTLLDYNGSGAAHYCVAWVTTGSGTFIKSLRKQGPSSWTSSQWGSHCGTWNSARNGSTILDGYTSATATSYSGTNSPVILTWNGRDASNTLMADGNYKFWVQYAEESGQGPHTTNGLSWTKGPAAATNNSANMGANFASIRIIWLPAAAPTLAPTITSPAPTAAGTVGVPYSYTCTATGTVPIKFFASNLPSGLAINTNGLISGIPTVTGTFDGTITATNGTLPNATQPFSIAIVTIPTSITAVGVTGGNLILSGSGPANGVYTVLASTNATQAIGQWTPLATNTIGVDGGFGFTNTIISTSPQQFYQLRLP